MTQTEIRTSFSERWEVESIEPTVIDLTWDPAGALAWQVAAIRKQRLRKLFVEPTTRSAEFLR